MYYVILEKCVGHKGFSNIVGLTESFDKAKEIAALAKKQTSYFYSICAITKIDELTSLRDVTKSGTIDGFYDKDCAFNEKLPYFSC